MSLRSIIAAFASGAVALASAGVHAETESRGALMIGNGAYMHAPVLTNLEAAFLAVATAGAARSAAGTILAADGDKRHARCGDRTSGDRISNSNPTSNGSRRHATCRSRGDMVA